MNNTQDKIKMVCDSLSEFLCEKNKRYGDSALNPINIFSKSDANTIILSRIDEKILRIKNSDELRKNDIVDLTGYLILYLISQNWEDFKEFLD